jgi:hypothetical protein
VFQSAIIDVATGMIFTFCAVSLAVSAITEALASIFKWRASNLLDGVASLPNDKSVTGLALQITITLWSIPSPRALPAREPKSSPNPPTSIPGNSRAL